MMIALPNPDRTLHRHAVLALRGTGGLRRAGRPAAAVDARFERDYADATHAVRGPRRRVRPQPRRHAGHRADVAVDPRPVGAAGRRRPRHRPVLRSGHELRLRGRRRARPLPRARPARTGRCALPTATPSGASPTPTPSPTSRSTTSSRCATRWARRCSGLGKRVEHAIERLGSRPLRVAVRAGQLHHRALRRGPAPGRRAAPVPGQRRRGGRRGAALVRRGREAGDARDRGAAGEARR